MKIFESSVLNITIFKNNSIQYINNADNAYEGGELIRDELLLMFDICIGFVFRLSIQGDIDRGSVSINIVDMPMSTVVSQLHFTEAKTI